MHLLPRRSIDLGGNDPGIAQVVVSVVFSLLAVIAVILRILSRRVSKVKLQLNDYMIIVALVGTLHIAGAVIISVVAGGAGLHEGTLSETQTIVYWKSIFIIIITWPIVQSTIKISVLHLYVHLFFVKPLRIGAYLLMAVCALWCVEQLLASLLICRPIAFNWDRQSKGGHCGNEAANSVAGAAINTAVDIATVCLPMPIIWRLQLPVRSKASLSFIFGLGGLICIISLIRLKALTTFTETDATYKNNLAIVLTLVESALGVISACLMIMRPLFGRFFPERLRLTKRGGRSSDSVIPLDGLSQRHIKTMKSSGPSPTSANGKFVRLDEDPYILPSLTVKRAAATEEVSLANDSVA